jgi:excisionase family DNA binding protein
MVNYVKARTIAEKLGYNLQYVNQLAKAGKIPALKRGRIWLFDESAVEKHFQDRNVQKLLD